MNNCFSGSLLLWLLAILYCVLQQFANKLIMMILVVSLSASHLSGVVSHYVHYVW